MKKQIDIYLLGRINMAVLEYYRLADEFKTEGNYLEWLATLKPVLKDHFADEGFKKGKDSIPFMRFILELNDIGMDEFLKNHLSSEDFAAWKNPDVNLFVPDEMNLLK